jgi:ParB family chromosome partitioning protein
MAISIDAQHEVKRGDFLYIHPDDVIVDESLRGRHKSPGKDAVESLAQSILEHGQRQAAEVRRLPNKKVQLVYGYTRLEAVKLLHAQGHTEIKFKVSVTTCNEREAFVANVVENKHRNATTPIDDAHNMRRLAEQHGMKNAEIAKLYRCSESWVSKLLKLLSLPAEVQERIQNGQLTAGIAEKLLLIEDAKKQIELLQECSDDEGQVSGAELKKLLREAVGGGSDDDTPASSTSGKGKGSQQSQATPSRSVREMRAFLEDCLTPEDETEGVKAFAKVMLDWVGGRKTDKQLYNAIKKLEGAK